MERNFKRIFGLESTYSLILTHELQQWKSSVFINGCIVIHAECHGGHFGTTPPNGGGVRNLVLLQATCRSGYGEGVESGRNKGEWRIF